MSDRITVLTQTDQGPVKPLHGVNNGPLSFGGLTDLSRSWKEAGFPFARLHDPEYPHPITVDIPQIFPDFNADPADPANYIFENTDASIRAILDCGAQVIYRLGTSIEHTVRKIYTDVPADMDRFAEICLHVVLHYHTGWANGIPGAIRFFEIWNEPDLGQEDMWKGTAEEYYTLYTVTAKKIKKACPELLIGGPALAFYKNEPFIRGFFDALVREKAPLDFFSWHLYSDDIDEYVRAMNTMRQTLDERGFGETLLICDEWNSSPATGFSLSNSSAEEERKKAAYFEGMTGPKGASLYAAVMTAFQRGPLDIACYYDSHPTNLWCGIFDRYGRPTLSFRAFEAFDRLYRMNGKCVSAVTEGQGLYALAAVKSDEIRLLVSRYAGESGEFSATFADLPSGEWQLLEQRIDAEHDFTEETGGVFEGNTWKGELRDNAVLLLSLTRRK